MICQYPRRGAEAVKTIVVTSDIRFIIPPKEHVQRKRPKILLARLV